MIVRTALVVILSTCIGGCAAFTCDVPVRASRLPGAKGYQLKCPTNGATLDLEVGPVRCLESCFDEAEKDG